HEGFWGNRKIGLKMLECAFAQGYGKAAYALGVTIDGDDKNLDEGYGHALRVLHEGVKMGCEKCANYLSSSFRHHDDPLTNNFIDTARSERYGALGDALYHNPDLRFPNLDKILPLPPATLPQWDSKIESLINAAKPVMPAPPPPAATPGANLSGRAHIPQQPEPQALAARVHSHLLQPTIAAEQPLKSLVNWRWRQTAVLRERRLPEPGKDCLVDVGSHMATRQLVEAGGRSLG
ncbi:DUF6396 domain-containing protein, partial [Collimonas silvisoli]|uniref:DUF6396 domain-containing protein n=1 Tax=Collimonas silvisoli TaxID=2825884 RepID=UPI001E5BEEE9